MDNDLTWTRELPTESGFYWFQGENEPEILNVYQIHTGEWMADCFGGYRDPLERYSDGRFAGPIEPPE